jgi:hypothetical protein
MLIGLDGGVSAAGVRRSESPYLPRGRCFIPYHEDCSAIISSVKDPKTFRTIFILAARTHWSMFV